MPRSFADGFGERKRSFLVSAITPIGETRLEVGSSAYCLEVADGIFLVDAGEDARRGRGRRGNAQDEADDEKSDQETELEHAEAKNRRHRKRKRGGDTREIFRMSDKKVKLVSKVESDDDGT